MEYGAVEDAEKAVCSLDLSIQLCFPTFGSITEGICCIMIYRLHSVARGSGEMVELEFAPCLLVWYFESYDCAIFSLSIVVFLAKLYAALR